MKRIEGAGLLLVTSILMTVVSSFIILIGIIPVFTAFFYIMRDIPEPFGIFLDPQFISGILFLLCGAAQLSAGIIGIVNSRRPGKAEVCLITGVIVIALFIIENLVSSFYGAGIYINIIKMLVGVVLPALYIIGSCIEKKEVVDIRYKTVAKKIKGSGLLKVTSIILIIGGSINILITSSISYTFTFRFPYFIDQSYFLPFMIIIIPFVFGAVQLAAGILGLSNSKKPGRSVPCIVMGIIVILLTVVVNVVFMVFVSHNIINFFLGLPLPVLYLIGATVYKNEVEVEVFW